MSSHTMRPSDLTADNVSSLVSTTHNCIARTCMGDIVFRMESTISAKRAPVTSVIEEGLNVSMQPVKAVDTELQRWRRADRSVAPVMVVLTEECRLLRALPFRPTTGWRISFAPTGDELFSLFLITFLKFKFDLSLKVLKSDTASALIAGIPLNSMKNALDLQYYTHQQIYLVD